MCELNDAFLQQCADKDLVHRLSRLKLHPETGQLYNRGQWMRVEEFNKKRENKDEEVEEEEEDEQVWLLGKKTLFPMGLKVTAFGFRE